MQKITPFLWFNDQAEEAANFYTRLFKDGKVGEITRFGAGAAGPEGKVMMVNFSLAGREITALNGGPDYSFTPATSFFVTCQTEAEVDALWKGLSAGGGVLMELNRYPFSEKFGWLVDRYGLSWQIDLTGQPQKVAPFLLFVGEQNGRAEEAIHFYTSLFKGSSIRQIERYGADAGGDEGNVIHAEFSLSGEEFMAMDSGLSHDFTFTPAMSFYVDCKDQAEVDYFWEKFTEGGEEVQCGWLTDKFGVSWQIVPRALIEMMNDKDPEKARRVNQAMLQMKKIDVGLLQQAYELV